MKDRLVAGLIYAVAAAIVGGLVWFAVAEPATPAERHGSIYGAP